MNFVIGSPRAALIVAPHPDDETIGAFCLIVALQRRRPPVRVQVLVASDGAASHPASAAWPHQRLVRERRRESLRAMARLGLSARDVRFLGLPDGRLDTAKPVIAAAVTRLCRGGLLVGPCADDDHPDHRATAQALANAQLSGVRRIAYQVWPAGARTASSRSLTLGTQRAAKRRAVLSYRTQTGAITDDPRGFAMSRREVTRFAGPREWYREQRR